MLVSCSGALPQHDRPRLARPRRALPGHRPHRDRLCRQARRVRPDRRGSSRRRRTPTPRRWSPPCRASATSAAQRHRRPAAEPRRPAAGCRFAAALPGGAGHLPPYLAGARDALGRPPRRVPRSDDAPRRSSTSAASAEVFRRGGVFGRAPDDARSTMSPSRIDDRPQVYVDRRRIRQRQDHAGAHDPARSSSRTCRRDPARSRGRMTGTGERIGSTTEFRRLVQPIFQNPFEAFSLLPAGRGPTCRAPRSTSRSPAPTPRPARPPTRRCAAVGLGSTGSRGKYVAPVLRRRAAAHLASPGR